MSTAMKMPTGTNQRKSTFPGAKEQEEATAKAEAVATLDLSTKKALRQEEDLNKKVILEREKDNYTQILALRCYNGWLKICDHSALILSKWLDGRLGKRYENHEDKGFGVQAEYGVVSIPDAQVGNFIERLARVGINIVYETEWLIEFDLGERVSHEDMVRMLHEDEMIIEKVNELVMPKAKLPVLRAEVKLMLVYVHSRIGAQREYTKEVFLNDVEKQVIELNKLIVATARGRVEETKCLELVGEYAEELYTDLTTMSDMKLITAKQYKEGVDIIQRIEAEQARAIKRLKVAQAEREIEESRKQTIRKEMNAKNRRGRVGPVQQTFAGFDELSGSDQNSQKVKK